MERYEDMPTTELTDLPQPIDMAEQRRAQLIEQFRNANLHCVKLALEGDGSPNHRYQLYQAGEHADAIGRKLCR